MSDSTHPFLSPASLEWLRFLKRHLRLLLVWPLIAIILGGVGWALLLAQLEEDRQEVENSALQHAKSQAKVFAGYLGQSLQSIDQLLLHVRYEWELSEGLLPLESIKETGIFPFPSQLYVGLTDAKGNILTSTIPDPNGVNVADRPYFKIQKAAEYDLLYIGEPTRGRLSQQNVIHMSRRIKDKGGDFGGVVMASVATDYFTTTYDETVLGSHGFLGVVGEDGAIRITRIGDTTYLPDSEALLEQPNIDSATGSAAFPGSMFADERSRFLGWHVVSNFPLVAYAGVDVRDALAQYRNARANAIENGIWATIALALFTAAAMSLSIRLAYRKSQIELARATYRMATEEGNEGFYIARALRDKNEVIVDFELVDCNHQGAAFLNLRRETVIGKRVSVLASIVRAQNILHQMMRAMEDGLYESEIQAADGQVRRWLHLKIVRSDGYLAIRLRDLTDTRAHVEALERRGNEDALTGLPNRHWVNGYLPRALSHAESNGLMLALLFIDLDGFKAVNDTMGHEAGDELLRNAGRRLKVAVRPGDHVVRIGGDEFVVILENIAQKKDAAHVAERVLHAFQEGFKVSKGVASVGTSIGISLFPDDGRDADTLLKSADIAMYSVKTSGKRSYRFYDQEFYEVLRSRHEKEAELRHAIEQDQFVMYYQPRVDMESGRMSSMEALVRWAHPMKGLLEPLEFIPLAEETGLILQLGEMVIDKVCAQVAFWGRHEQALVPVSINVSPRQFSEANIAKVLQESLSRYGVDPRLVEIELTESSMMSGTADVSEVLTKIQAMGITLSIDDFGTGYSSLSQLQQLDFDVLKVDRAFTSKIGKTDQGNVFFNAIITMAHALGMRVVAEGVEDERQVSILKALHCDEIQGFYISRPIPPAETQPMMMARRLSPAM